jgi:hypothetical protein
MPSTYAFSFFNVSTSERARLAICFAFLSADRYRSICVTSDPSDNEDLERL